MIKHQISRRGFIKGTGTLTVGFTVGAAAVSKWLFAPEGAAAQVGSDLIADTWLVVNTNGTVTIFSDKLELGTGIQTAFCQIAAEELYVNVGDITYMQGDTSQTSLLSWDIGYTAGSQSIQRGGVALRQAAATAFQWLLQQAAQRLSVDPSQLQAGGGKIGVGPDQQHALPNGAPSQGTATPL